MYSIDPVKVIDDRDEYGNAVQMSLLSICEVLFQWQGSKTRQITLISAPSNE